MNTAKQKAFSFRPVGGRSTYITELSDLYWVRTFKSLENIPLLHYTLVSIYNLLVVSDRTLFYAFS